MNAYGTYIWGKDAVLLDLPLPIWNPPYRSNWRVLHIDGFEPTFMLNPQVYRFKYDVSIPQEPPFGGARLA